MTEEIKKQEQNDEIDLIEVGLRFWKYRKFIIIFTSTVVVLAVIYALIKSPTYESYTTLYDVKTGGAPKSQLGALASQMGFSSMQGQQELSFNLKDLIGSRKILQRIITHKWGSEEFEDSVTLIDYWEIDVEEEDGGYQKELSSALEAIKNYINLTADEESGLFTITVEMPEAQLAADIANFTAETLANYIQNERQTSTKRNLDHITKRIDTVVQELSNAEEALKEFRQSNRNITGSPELQLEFGRLKREVTIKQEVYITLQKEKEMAHIELVKETPVFNIIDEAIPPQQRASPKRRLIVIIGGFLGGFLSIFSLIAWFVFQYVRDAIKEKQEEEEAKGE